MTAEYSVPNVEEALEGALDSSLDERYELYLASQTEEADSTVDVGTQFQISDQASAEWALRKIRQAQRIIAATDEATQLQVDVVMAKAEELCAPLLVNQAEENAKHGQTVAFFTQLLGTYHRKLLAEDPDRKTIKLAFGTLAARKSPDSWEFDTEAFLTWCQTPSLPTGEVDPEGFPVLVPDPARRAFLRVKVEPNVAEAKKLLVLAGEKVVEPTSGEEVPGVVVVPGDVKFTVSPLTEVSK